MPGQWRLLATVQRGGRNDGVPAGTTTPRGLDAPVDPALPGTHAAGPQSRVGFADSPPKLPECQSPVHKLSYVR